MEGIKEAVCFCVLTHRGSVVVSYWIGTFTEDPTIQQHSIESPPFQPQSHRALEVDAIGIHLAGPSDGVDHVCGLAIHRDHGIDLLYCIRRKRLPRIHARDSGAEISGFQDQNLAGLGGPGRRDWREVPFDGPGFRREPSLRRTFLRFVTPPPGGCRRSVTRPSNRTVLT